MKKIKKLLAVISSAIIATTGIMSASFVNAETVSNDTNTEATVYEINNDDYAKAIDSFRGTIPKEAEFIECFADRFENDPWLIANFGEDHVLKHVYKDSNFSISMHLKLEFEAPDSSRIFTSIMVKRNRVFIGDKNSSSEEEAFRQSNDFETVNEAILAMGGVYILTNNNYPAHLGLTCGIYDTYEIYMDNIILLNKCYGFVPDYIGQFSGWCDDVMPWNARYYNDNVTVIPDNEEITVEPVVTTAPDNIEILTQTVIVSSPEDVTAIISVPKPEETTAPEADGEVTTTTTVKKVPYLETNLVLFLSVPQGNISITNMPKTTYVVGDELDFSELRVNRDEMWADEFPELVLENVSPYDYPDVLCVETSEVDMSKPGVYTVYVCGYYDCRAKFDIFEIEVTDPDVQSLLEVGVPSKMGDIDLNSDVGVADVTFLAKYISNSTLNPITDSTSAANADLNGDKTINSKDTSILIEYLLGSISSLELK